ncbi:hypothetical protein ACI2JA_03710 [Alkalihalobacillus sp. NPDC078783]
MNNKNEYKRDVHNYFGLTYSNYLVLPRSVIQSMPNEWQHKFVELLEELDNTGWSESLPEGAYKIDYYSYAYEQDEHGEEVFTWKNELTDPFLDYKRGRRNVFKESKKV